MDTEHNLDNKNLNPLRVFFQFEIQNLHSKIEKRISVFIVAKLVTDLRMLGTIILSCENIGLQKKMNISINCSPKT